MRTIVVASCLLLAAACGNDRGASTPVGPSPTAPAAPNPPVSLAVTPAGAGLAAVTTFSFTASNFVARSGSLQFSWDFGDGASLTTASPQATRLYQGAGTFDVRVSGSDAQGVIGTAVSRAGSGS